MKRVKFLNDFRNAFFNSIKNTISFNLYFLTDNIKNVKIMQAGFGRSFLSVARLICYKDQHATQRCPEVQFSGIYESQAYQIGQLQKIDVDQATHEKETFMV